MSALSQRAMAPQTVGAALAAAAARLGAAGIEEPRREARLLMGAALACDAASVLGYPERRLPADAADRFEALVRRRAAREPAARLLGRREFWGEDFMLSPATLVPRPESETLIEAALDRVADRHAGLRLLDFGTGTGCLLLALLKELPAATGYGIDLAEEAVATARANAERLGLAGRAAFFIGSWGAAATGAFDVILANPPYLRRADIAGLALEVARHDPGLALDGGEDGLSAFRRLAPDMARLLAPGGLAFVEIGAGQRAAASEIMEEAGLAVRDIRHDLSGIERCLVLARDGRPNGKQIAENAE
ncbi:MAG TPA: peptide chain release factor N(5)-glutamine methyltransferase [Stellaceae bacterium]|nr:peptide chain release factor N(5)-glutamine methyltransferase [Stellaceae bacterium]